MEHNLCFEKNHDLKQNFIALRVQVFGCNFNHVERTENVSIKSVIDICLYSLEANALPRDGHVGFIYQKYNIK